MATYISILRGINVSGHNLIKMDALKKMYEELKFKNVSSYVQSGNVIFTYKKTNLETLASKISKQIEADFGYQVPVIILTKESLQTIVEENPFINDPEKDSSFFYVTFLAEMPKVYDLNSIENKKVATEAMHIAEHAIYLYCPGGYGNTKLNNTFFESKLKVRATTRNWKTTTELLNIAVK